VGRQTPRQEAKNPLLDDAALILQARETLDAEVLAFATAVQRGPQSCYDVICFSAIESTGRVQRPRQVMAQFAAAGHRVFYISQHFRPKGLPYELVEIATNTYQVSLGTRHNVHTDRLNDEARDDLFAALDTLRCEQGGGAKVLYVQLPFWRPLVERLRAELNWPVVYDCVGFHAGSSANGHGVLGDEDALLELADLLIVSSLVGETARRQRSPRQLLLCAPRDYDQLAQVAPQPSGIAAALQQTNDEQRHALAREQSLESRFADLNGAIRATFPLTSIIIVTFNNLSLNRLCLQTLYAYTDWPNFEVIVVDNGSTDGTREYLKEAERQFSQLRVVFNGANLGFARANNIGLQKARGEYLVLLNNDTVVVQGWLSALIRHLVADQTIGLIGPVTNETGNEAKVPVGYQQLDEMPAWAMEFTRAHDAYTFDIPMLAMFCVAMRRATFAEIGPLDEQFGIGMFEDDDYSLRMKMGGYRVVCAADAFVHHFGCASFNKLMESDAYQRLFTENRQRYEAKWKIGWTPHQQGALKPASESQRTGLTQR
jgi:GT2 family glycosyltransferase